MYCVVAAVDVDPAVLEELRGSLRSLGDPVDLVGPVGPHWMAVLGADRNAVGTAAEGGVHLATFGTGLHTSHGSTDAAAAELARRAAATGLHDAPDDSVAVALDPARGLLSAAVGAGWHRLFTAEVGGGAVVCSNLGVLARLLGDRVEPDRSYEDFLLGFGFLPDDRTVHRGVRVIGPGVRHWGTPPAAAPSTATDPAATDAARDVPSFEAAADELHDRFMQAVEEVAGPSQEVAVLLGGFDSALVAAALSRLGRKVSTYTFGFGDARYEQRNVGVVTRAVGSREHWVHMSPEVIMEGLWDFGRIYAQPGPQPHYQVHTLHASRRIREDGFDMVLTGDGCDAIFLGYPMVNTRARLLAALRSAPAPLVRLGLRAASTRLADRYLGHVARMARSTLGSLLLPMPARGHLPTRYLDEVALARLRTGPPPAQTETVEQVRLRLAEGLADLDPVRLAFQGNAATGQSRVKVDGAVAATGLRQYSPFLQPSLRDFVAGLPIEYLRPPGTAAGSAGKAVLIEMIRRHRLLPDEVVDMPKQSPVDAPVDAWYAGPLRGELLDLLDHLPFEWDRAYVDELLRPKFVEHLYRERVALGHHTFQAVGLLASYASFHRR